MNQTPWPHAPPHAFSQQGTYMVTSGTYQKEHLFNSADRLSLLCDSLLALAKEHGWILHAWAVFSNHYHFVVQNSQDASPLGSWIAQLHQHTSSEINREDNTSGRKVWYQFWDSRITRQTSYLARLNYVHRNPEKHGLVPVASQYRWCSAGQFETTAPRAYVKSVYSFDATKVNTLDEF